MKMQEQTTQNMKWQYQATRLDFFKYNLIFHKKSTHGIYLFFEEQCVYSNVMSQGTDFTT